MSIRRASQAASTKAIINHPLGKQEEGALVTRCTTKTITNTPPAHQHGEKEGEQQNPNQKTNTNATTYCTVSTSSSSDDDDDDGVFDRRRRKQTKTMVEGREIDRQTDRPGQTGTYIIYPLVPIQSMRMYVASKTF